MTRKIAKTAAAVAMATGLLGAGMGPAAAADSTFSCSIGVGLYYSCASDNYTVAPGHKVYIALNTSGGKGVYFRLYNNNGQHLLSDPGIKQSPDGSFYFFWTNNTSGNIVTNITADAAAVVSVYAVATLRIV